MSIRDGNFDPASPHVSLYVDLFCCSLVHRFLGRLDSRGCLVAVWCAPWSPAGPRASLDSRRVVLFIFASLSWSPVQANRWSRATKLTQKLTNRTSNAQDARNDVDSNFGRGGGGKSAAGHCFDTCGRKCDSETAHGSQGCPQVATMVPKCSPKVEKTKQEAFKIVAKGKQMVPQGGHKLPQ